MKTYKGHTYWRTNQTTETDRYIYGRPYRTIVRLWRVEGPMVRPGQGQQWLRSASDCKAWINEAIAYRDEVRRDADEVQL